MAAECFQPDARCLRDVRRFLRDATTSLDPDISEVVVLLGHELAANAVVHAATVFEVHIAIASGCVNVMVKDRSARLPRVEPPDQSIDRGRGLSIVAAFADRWDVSSTPEGKCVWFEVATRDRAEKATMISLKRGGQLVALRPSALDKRGTPI